MGYFVNRQKRKSFEYCVKEAVKILKISKEEAIKRVSRVLQEPSLKELGGPDSETYQVACDIMMQIPSDKPITKEAMEEVVKNNRKNK